MYKHLSLIATDLWDHSRKPECTGQGTAMKFGARVGPTVLGHCGATGGSPNMQAKPCCTPSWPHIMWLACAKHLMTAVGTTTSNPFWVKLDYKMTYPKHCNLTEHCSIHCVKIKKAICYFCLIFLSQELVSINHIRHISTRQVPGHLWLKSDEVNLLAWSAQPLCFHIKMAL